MSVNSVSANHQQVAAQQLQAASQTQRKDSDGDADGSSAVAAQAAPTTNTSGQTVGTHVNTTA